MNTSKKLKKDSHVYMKIKGVLVPFYQSNGQLESHHVLTTNDGKEYTLLTTDATRYLGHLTWSLIDVFGYLVDDIDGRKVIQIDHYTCDEDDRESTLPFESYYESVDYESNELKKYY